jgi:copper chaperone CopZ
MEESCHVSPVQKTVSSVERRIQSRAALAVSGMGCPNCAMRVRNSLLNLHGVVAAEVDHISGSALVMFNPELVESQTLLLAVEAAGNDGRHRYSALLMN